MSVGRFEGFNWNDVLKIGRVWVFNDMRKNKLGKCVICNHYWRKVDYGKQCIYIYKDGIKVLCCLSHPGIREEYIKQKIKDFFGIETLDETSIKEILRNRLKELEENGFITDFNQIKLDTITLKGGIHGARIQGEICL